MQVTIRNALSIVLPRRYKTISSTASTASDMRLVAYTTASLLLSAFHVQIRRVSSLSISTGQRDPNMNRSSLESSQALMESLQARLENTWIKQLSPETKENRLRSLQRERLPETHDNRHQRPVYNGHYVLVKPTGIQDPQLVLVSQDMIEQLELTKEQVLSPDFTNYVSGNLPIGDSWATPYALSIVGTKYTSNCPYGTGDGYGDGRAISIGEWNGLELQLKGAGKTPFCRGADGRAVLRSSIREFLASEAMYHLGVPTTRALSLVVSLSDTVSRPWYTPGVALQLPTLDDPRLASYTDEQKRQLLSQLRNEKMDPNLMISEPCAITCRVSKSFCRIGHVDLFARRAEKKSMQNAKVTNSRYDTSTNEWKELEDMIWHVCFREFRTQAYDPYFQSKDIAAAATVLLELSADRIATMTSQWIRVGFAQGNFNADNCLIGGHTMDYGPFGYMEEYFPGFAKWTGSGEHFGFLNQPEAGLANYQVLVESIVPVICAATNNEEGQTDLTNEFLNNAKAIFDNKTDQVFRTKLGFNKDMELADSLMKTLEPLMRKTRADWTLFWRQLTHVARDFEDYNSINYEAMLDTLVSHGTSSPFYEPLTPQHKEQYLEWIHLWRDMLIGQVDVAENMRMVNPKYILREWMMVEAYKQAQTGNLETLQDLYEVIQSPYDEGTLVQQEEYYCRANEADLTKAGTAFFSCSS